MVVRRAAGEPRDGLRLAAIPLLAAQLTDDPFLVGAVAAAGGLPWLLTGLLSGSLVDRFGARWIVPLADVATVVVLTVLIALLLANRADVGALLTAAFVLGMAETLRDTGAETVLPRLVGEDQLERAGGRLTAGAVIGNEFVGPLLGGALFAAGAVLPFTTSGAVTALAVLLLVSLPAPVLRLLSASVPPASGAEAGVRAGLVWLGRQRVLRALVLVVAVVALADSAWFSIFVLYVDVRLGLGPAGFGVLLAVGAAGGLVGALLADRLVGGPRHQRVIGWSSAVATLTPALLLVASRLWLAVVVVVATSAAFGVLNVAAAGLRYRVVPDYLRGRVSAAWRTSAYAAGGAGALIGGTTASARGLTAPFILSAVLGSVVTCAWVAASRAAPGTA